MNSLVTSLLKFMREAAHIDEARTLVIIHKNDLIRHGLAAILGEIGFALELCKTWPEARAAIIAKNPKPLLICDETSLPHMPELLSLLKAKDIILVQSDIKDALPAFARYNVF